MGKLVIVRHGESEWNIIGKWTGLTDVHLSEKGSKESKRIGALIKDIHFGYIFTSNLIRTKETLSAISSVYEELKSVETEESKEIRERDYGDYTGKNKWEMEKILGEKEFLNIRRSWDHPIPNGESLKMVYERTIPFFLDTILPKIKEGVNVLVVAHGNSIRSMVKYIENISDEKIAEVEMPFQDVLVYDLDESGHVVHKEISRLD